jgi:hypothetical protein
MMTEAKGLCKAFKENVVLDGIDLNVKKGLDAVAWCVGLALVGYLSALRAYNRNSNT